jgi:hypothetical protein
VFGPVPAGRARFDGRGDRERRVHLGDGSPDSRGCLPFSVAEVLMRLFCEVLGAEEMFRSGHRPSSCPGVGYWSDTALIHAVNFICLPGPNGKPGQGASRDCGHDWPLALWPGGYERGPADMTIAGAQSLAARPGATTWGRLAAS